MRSWSLQRRDHQIHLPQNFSLFRNAYRRARETRNRERLRVQACAPASEPVFLTKNQAINYAQNRASFRTGKIRILDPS